MMTFGSLFAGIGGMDLGLERAGMQCVWQVEINAFCQKVLAKHWPDVHRHGDVSEFHCDQGECDVIAGGFPCQDVSTAGQQQGINGSRSGLWSEFARVIDEARPQWVIIENVPGLFVNGFGRVVGDLADLGLDARWGVFSACAFGAPHVRRRVFIVAHSDSDRLQRVFKWMEQEQTRLQLPERQNASRRRWKEQLPSPVFCRGADRIPNRVDRTRSLGNAVVPQVAEFIGRAILNAEGS